MTEEPGRKTPGDSLRDCGLAFWDTWGDEDFFDWLNNGTHSVLLPYKERDEHPLKIYLVSTVDKDGITKEQQPFWLNVTENARRAADTEFGILMRKPNRQERLQAILYDLMTAVSMIAYPLLLSVHDTTLYLVLYFGFFSDMTIKSIACMFWERRSPAAAEKWFKEYGVVELIGCVWFAVTVHPDLRFLFSEAWYTLGAFFGAAILVSCLYQFRPIFVSLYDSLRDAPAKVDAIHDDEIINYLSTRFSFFIETYGKAQGFVSSPQLSETLEVISAYTDCEEKIICRLLKDAGYQRWMEKKAALFVSAGLDASGLQASSTTEPDTRSRSFSLVRLICSKTKKIKSFLIFIYTVFTAIRLTLHAIRGDWELVLSVLGGWMDGMIWMFLKFRDSVPLHSFFVYYLPQLSILVLPTTIAIMDFAWPSVLKRSVWILVFATIMQRYYAEFSGLFIHRLKRNLSNGGIQKIEAWLTNNCLAWCFW